MFNKRPFESKLDAELISALEQLESITDKSSEEYGTLIEHIARLHKLKTDERPNQQISPDTVLVVAANIFGILWLARYERENVIKGRSALGFVMKPHR